MGSNKNGNCVAPTYSLAVLSLLSYSASSLKWESGRKQWNGETPARACAGLLSWNRCKPLGEPRREWSSCINMLKNLTVQHLYILQWIVHPGLFRLTHPVTPTPALVSDHRAQTGRVIQTHGCHYIYAVQYNYTHLLNRPQWLCAVLRGWGWGERLIKQMTSAQHSWTPLQEHQHWAQRGMDTLYNSGEEPDS